MLKKKYWLIFLMIFLSIAAICIFWSTLHQAISSKKTENNLASPKVGESDEFIGMRIKIPGSDKGGYWELSVKKLESREEVGRLSQIEGDYFIKQKPVYRLTGKNGIIHWNNKIFEVKGNVVLKTTDNSKSLTADEMIWDSGHQRITFQHRAVLQTEQLIITADAIHSNLDLNQVLFAGFTKAVYMSSTSTSN